MSWTDTSYTSQPLTPPRTHSLFFPSLFLQYTLCLYKNKRVGQEESEWVRREWRWEGGEKNRETGEIRLSAGLAEGQSWQARRLNCWVKILFIIIRSLFPNSPLLCYGQCPASTSPSPGFIRHCWAVRTGILLLYNSSTDPMARTMSLPLQLRRFAWAEMRCGPDTKVGICACLWITWYRKKNSLSSCWPVWKIIIKLTRKTFYTNSCLFEGIIL